MLQAFHDRLIAQKPDGAEHDETTCPLCAMAADPNTTTRGAPIMAELSDEEIQAKIDQAVAAATAPLQSRINELTAAADDAAIDAKVAAATEALVAEKADLQTQLDAAMAAKTAAETELAEFKSTLETMAREADEAAALATAKAERVDEVTKLNVFDEKYIDTHADRFAAMSAEEWAANVESWKLIATARPATTSTAFRASRQPDSGQPASHLHLIGEMRGAGQDTRTA